MSSADHFVTTTLVFVVDDVLLLEEVVVDEADVRSADVVADIEVSLNENGNVVLDEDSDVVVDEDTEDVVDEETDEVADEDVDDEDDVTEDVEVVVMHSGGETMSTPLVNGLYPFGRSSGTELLSTSAE